MKIKTLTGTLTITLTLMSTLTISAKTYYAKPNGTGDGTSYEKAGALYLLTFLMDGASERVTPRAYAMTIREGGSALEPMDWPEV